MSFLLTHAKPIATAKMRIGLFGGSFNPAHQGHLHIAKTALKRLQLDKVWWLLSPQNPLKNKQDYASYEDRAASALGVIDTPQIELSYFEAEHNLTYSVDTITQLQKLHPQTHFVWLMGADGFADLDNWHAWQTIVETIPIAIFNRPGFGFKALGSKAAQRYGAYRFDEYDAALLPGHSAPAWCFMNQPLDFSASRDIRSENNEH